MADKGIPPFIRSHSIPRSPDLSRTYRLMETLGNPQLKFRAVHVAGTNGKGSMSAFLATIFKEAGLSTGLFTSPFLQRFNERMRIDMLPASDAELSECFERVGWAERRMGQDISAFEGMTAAAFLCFEKRQVDMAVIEVGVGGRLDPTNVLPAGAIAIGEISMDHQHMLGDTIEAIAREKAGVFKRGARAFAQPQLSCAREVLMREAKTKGTELFLIEESGIAVLEDGLERRCFNLSHGEFALEALEVGPLGAHQFRNAAVAACIALDLGIDETAVRRGIVEMRWPGRLELVSCDGMQLLLDGAHNEGGAKALHDAMLRYFKDCRKVLVVGVSMNKDCAVLAKAWAGLFDAVIATEADDPPMHPAFEVAATFCAEGYSGALAVPDAAGALKSAREQYPGALVVVAGSLYLVGAIRELVHL